MKRLLTPGAFFAVWRELSDTLYSPSPAIEVRLASYLSAPTPRYIPPREKLEETVSIFTLNVTQTAEVFGVSRTAIYDWREGKAVSQKHQERISQIYEYALALKEVDSTPIGEALTWQDAESGQSLLSLLKAEPLDDTRIHQFIKALPERIQEWWAPANALIAAHNKDGWAPVPDALREERRNRSAGRNVRLGGSNLEIP
jgi:transcriptional regulator with XRE-family HTH domain